MAIDATEFQKLKDSAKKIKSEIDQAQGTLAAKMETLKKDFDCSTFEEGQKLLETMRTALDLSEKIYEDEVKKFKELYADLL